MKLGRTGSFSGTLRNTPPANRYARHFGIVAMEFVFGLGSGTTADEIEHVIDRVASLARLPV